MTNPWLKLRLTPPDATKMSIAGGGVHKANANAAAGPAKICDKCDIEKELLKFYKHPSYSDGYRTTCIACVKATGLYRRS